MRPTGVPAMLATLLLLGSCKDAAGPAPAGQAELAVVRASGPDTLVGVLKDGAFSCTYSVRISGEGPPGALAHWGGGAVTLTMLNAPFGTHFDTLSAGEVRGLFGGSTIRPGETKSAVLSTGFQLPAASPENAQLGAHDARWLFTYSVGNKKGAVTYDARCVAPPPPPPLPLLSGPYVLTTINDVPVPAFDVVADTFTFYPDTTYSISATLAGRSPGSNSVARQRYTLVSRDTVHLPSLLAPFSGGKFYRSGTTLHYQTFEMAWRFDLVGTTPQLPPPPRIVVSRDTVRFSAVRGGPLPDSQVVQITSSTPRQITRILGGACLGTLASNGLCTSRWGSASSAADRTPTSMTFRVLTTELPPGTYTGRADLVTIAAVNSPYTIQFVYTVTAP